jgi:hypothetical protein
MIKENTDFIARPFLLASMLLIMSSGFSDTASIEQHPPHEHGAASLTIAVDANNLEIDLESPADNIFGFEYVPSSKEDKKKVKDAVSQLKAAKALFTIPDVAHCHLDQVNVSSPMLENNHTDKNKSTEPHHAHNDVDASWYYNCESGKNLNAITPHFFTIFSPGFKRLKVDWLTPTGVSSSLITEDTTIKLKP